jgi:hypothetical protein
LLPGSQEFLDSVSEIADRLGWPIVPSDQRLLRCRLHALELNDDSGSPAVEVASIFFALAHDERRIWPVQRLLPFALTLHYLFERRLMLHFDDPAELAWLRHAIAEGSADWPEVRAWFINHTRPRP